MFGLMFPLFFLNYSPFCGRGGTGERGEGRGQRGQFLMAFIFYNCFFFPISFSFTFPNPSLTVFVFVLFLVCVCVFSVSISLQFLWVFLEYLLFSSFFFFFFFGGGGGGVSNFFCIFWHFLSEFFERSSTMSGSFCCFCNYFWQFLSFIFIISF